MSNALPVLFSGAQVRVTTHPDGFAHVRATIAKMAELARAGSHSFEIRDLAVRITHSVPSKQVRAELEALYRWVRDHIRYRFDPVDLEWVQSPARTVQQQAGDCDDMATLLAALAGALGHRWQFVTVGPSSSAQRHIAAQVFDGRDWVTLDPVLEPAPATTAARADLGRFGHKAPGGFEHTWNMQGALMRSRNLSGPVSPGEVALWRGHLGGMPTALQRQLWTRGDVAYYPQPGRVGAGAGVAARATPTYASQYSLQAWLWTPPAPTVGLSGHGGPGPFVLVLPYGVVDRRALDGVAMGANGPVFWAQHSLDGLGRTDAGSKADTPDRLRFVWRWYKYEPPAKRPPKWHPDSPDAEILAWWGKVSPDNRQMFRESYAATMDYAPKALSDEGKREWWVKLSKDQRVDKRRHYQGGFWGSLKQIGQDIVKPIAKIHAATTGRVTSFLHKITHTGPIRDIEKQVQGIVGKVPFFKPFIDFHENTSARLTEQVMVGTGAIKKEQARGPVIKPTLEQSAELLDKGSGGRITPEKGIQAAGAAAGKAAAGANINIKIPAGVKAAGAKALSIPGVKQTVEAGAARAASAARGALNTATSAATAAARGAINATGLVTATPRRSNWKEPHADVRKKYPGNARQVFDSKSSVFLVYVPKSTAAVVGKQATPAFRTLVKGMSGLGFIRPTLSFSLAGLGAQMTAADYKRNGATFATLAANAVAAYIAKNKIPPGGKLAQVEEFQKYDSLRRNAGFTGTALSVDGVWGPNARAAAAWYRGQQVTQQPAVKPALAGTKFTWTPPVAAAVVAAAAAPKPAAPKPAPSSGKPVVTVTPAGTHPVAATPVKPKPPAPAPVGPVTGYQQVGAEVNNPGLPPLGAPASKPPPVITVTPAGTHAVAVKPPPKPPVAVKPPAPKPKPKPAPVAVKPQPTYAPPPRPAPVPQPIYLPAPPSSGVTIDIDGPAVTSAPALPPPLLPAGPGGPTFNDLPTAPAVAPAARDYTAMYIGGALLAYMLTQRSAPRRRRRRAA